MADPTLDREAIRARAEQQMEWYPAGNRQLPLDVFALLAALEKSEEERDEALKALESTLAVNRNYLDERDDARDAQIEAEKERDEAVSVVRHVADLSFCPWCESHYAACRDSYYDKEPEPESEPMEVETIPPRVINVADVLAVVDELREESRKDEDISGRFSENPEWIRAGERAKTYNDAANLIEERLHLRRSPR